MHQLKANGKIKGQSSTHRYFIASAADPGRPLEVDYLLVVLENGRWAVYYDLPQDVVKMITWAKGIYEVT